MREREINKLISDAMRDAPSAPDELRHNVMSVINELEYEPKRRKISVFKVAAPLATVAILAVVIIAVGTRLDKNTAFPQSFSLDTGGSGAVAMDGIVPETEEAVMPYQSVEPEPDTDEETNDEYIAEMAAENSIYLVTGILPIELEGLEYSENSDGSRVYENVPDEVVAMMLANNSNIIEVDIAVSGNTVEWTP